MKALLLGLIQGLTEFLPVSSSGHLVLAQNLFGFSEPELLFDIVVHSGTLLAVIIFFRQDVISLVYEAVTLPGYLLGRGSLSQAWNNRPGFRMILLIIVGSIPTGLMGVLFKDQFELLFGSVRAVGMALCATGVLLFLTRLLSSWGRGIGQARLSDALIVGVAQGLAITPGISRSGATISTALYLGLDRELAARLSFLMSIPAIAGALVLELSSASAGSFSYGELAAGFTAALVSGLAALTLLLRLVHRGRLHYFAYYCWIIGPVAIVASFL